MTFILKSAILVLFTCTVVRSQGTTGQLEDIFKGRCLNYKITRANTLTDIPTVDCNELWTNFSRSWTFKDSCSQNVTSYANVFNFLNQTLPKDKALLWSGTNDFAHAFSNNGKRYITLEDTLIGFIANGLDWCGQTSAPGINYRSCPAYFSCPGEVKSSYWLEASKWFASNAEGDIHVALNGSMSGNRLAYRRDSIFASVEVPTLRSGRVKKLTAILVHDLGRPITESCGSQSLLDLKSDLHAKNIAFDCVENPPEVKYLLCYDTPNSPECDQCDPSGRSTGGAAGLIKTGGGIHNHLVALITFVTSITVKLIIN
uniref:Uncharacterized protein n=1 Tax=Arion vulgaris TaxID=1028688 RepID=A0A0B7BU80_9EUPU